MRETSLLAGPAVTVLVLLAVVACLLSQKEQPADDGPDAGEGAPELAAHADLPQDPVGDQGAPTGDDESAPTRGDLGSSGPLGGKVAR